VDTRPTAIEALSRRPTESGLILDFDGVLSPIVEDPTTSALPASTAAVLARIVRVLGLVAVISGRPAQFLADHVKVSGIPLLGSYGIEEVRHGTWHVHPAANEWLGVVHDASRLLANELGSSPGIRVEEKSVSVAVHWRQAADQEAAAARVRQVTASIAAATGLRLEPGKLVEELRPPIEMDKGSAVSEMLTKKKLVMSAYAGDDLGDLPALNRVHDAGGYALVVDHGPETDESLLTVADQIFDGTEAFAAWLADLADALGA
jgi:trehalose 6-phosphate phosphatase